MKITHSHIEKYYPIVVSIIVLVALFIYQPIDKDEAGSIVASSLTIFSVIFGFFLTILTILKSFESNRAIKLLRKANRYDDFLKYIKKPLKCSLYITILSFIGIVIPDLFLWHNLLLLNILVFLSVYTLLMSIRFIQILLLLIDG